MVWQKGQSGNPDGRPRKNGPLLDWCYEWTVKEAAKVLIPIASDPKRKDQLKAVEMIMSYGIGKPLQVNESTVQLAGDVESLQSAHERFINLAGGKGGINAANDGDGGAKGADASMLLHPERGSGEGCNGDRANGEIH